jgi:hypothetical protein
MLGVSHREAPESVRKQKEPPGKKSLLWPFFRKEFSREGKWV